MNLIRCFLVTALLCEASDNVIHAVDIVIAPPNRTNKRPRYSMSQRKPNIASAFSHLGLARPWTAELSETSASSTVSSRPSSSYYSSSSSAAPGNLLSSNMNQHSALQPPAGASLEHKTSSTSIRSLLNDPIAENMRPVSRDRRSSPDPPRQAPIRDPRQRSPGETPRANSTSRFPSPGDRLSVAGRPRNRKVSEGGSGGETSSRGSNDGVERPRSTVSDASSQFEYPFPTPSSTASISFQQPYLAGSTSTDPDMYSTMPSKAIQTNGSSRAPISRATKACNACRSRKVRCDAGGPESSAAGKELPCTRCNDSGIQCVYTGSQRKRGPAPGANRPGQRRKSSMLELDMVPTGLSAGHDMTRTRSTSSIGSGNGHYHPYAPVGILPSPPSAYRGMPQSTKNHPPYHPNDRFEYGRQAPPTYDRAFGGVPRGPMTAPLPGYIPREHEYRHPMSADGQYPPPPLSGPPYGFSHHEQMSRHPAPPLNVMQHDYARQQRPSYGEIDPGLQVEPPRPSTGLSGWQGGEPNSAGARPMTEQEPPSRAHEAAIYQAGYEAALREARIAAKVEAQREEQDRRDRERERMMLLERGARPVGGQPPPPPRGYEDQRRTSYWERIDPGREKPEERMSDRGRERQPQAEMGNSAREHHYGEIDTRVTLPPIKQMDR